jgi:N-acetylmuramoyl-L-alanine amidase
MSRNGSGERRVRWRTIGLLSSSFLGLVAVTLVLVVSVSAHSKNPHKVVDHVDHTPATSHPKTPTSTTTQRPLDGMVVSVDPGHNGGNFDDPTYINQMI